MKEKMDNLPPGFEELDVVGYKTIDIVPEHLKSPVPVVMAPGWSITEVSMEIPAEALSKRGYRVLTLDHHRQIPAEITGTEFEGQQIPSVEIQKALSILEVLKGKGLDQVDGIGYSEGGINLCLAALLSPEKFRNIVLVDPAGMIGKDSFLSLVLRFSLEESGDLLFKKMPPGDRGHLLKTLYEQAKYVLKNPSLAVREIVAISKSDITKLIQELKGRGIGISIIQGADDKTFLMSRVQEETEKKMVDGFYSIKGDHFNIISNSDEVMLVADQALSSLADKKERAEKI